MAIGSKVTVTRELSSKTQTGLSELIARAFSLEEAFGFDKDGLKLVNDAGGEHQKSTIAVKWKESRNEVKQVFTVNPGNILTGLNLSAATAVKKVQRATISITGNQTTNFGSDSKFVSFTFGTRTLTQVLTPQTVGLGNITDAMIVVLRNQPEVVSVNEISDTVIEMTYTIGAGDISIGFEVDVKYNNGNFGRRYTLTRSTTTAFIAASKAATITMEIENNVGLSGATGMEFDNLSSTTTVAEGASLNWWEVANQEIGLLDRSSSFESRKGLADGNYQIALNSGFANASLTIKATASRQGESDVVYRDVAGFREVTSTNTDATAYVSNITETNGTLLVRVQDPEDGQFHTASITVPADTAITEVETIIRDAINTAVIGVDSLGANIYMSTIVKATVGDITTAAGVSSFTVTLDWASVGTTSNNGLSIDSTGLIDPAANVTTVARVTAGANPSSIASIPWKFVSTSATLQPGGDTTHYATLVFTKPTPTP